MIFHDRALIDGPARITRDGHLVASARVARANNIQDYMPAELGLQPKADGTPYRIFRPESEVFARDAIASAAHRPVTIDHPGEDVNAANWKSLAVGDTGGEALRDGEFLRVPVMVMDARGVKAATTTHQEFSLGYSADIDMTPGRFGDADYDGSMRSIRVNHLALCGTARGGSDLRIVDERPAHLRDHQEKPVKKILLDGLTVDIADAETAEATIRKLESERNEARGKLTDAESKVGTLTGEKATLEGKLAAAAITPQQMRDAARSYAATVGKAKALGVAITDAMDEPAIMKAVVAAKVGDAAAGFDDKQIAACFVAVTKDTKVADADPLRNAIAGGVTITDAASGYHDARAKQRAAITGAWKRPVAA